MMLKRKHRNHFVRGIALLLCSIFFTCGSAVAAKAGKSIPGTGKSKKTTAESKKRIQVTEKKSKDQFDEKSDPPEKTMTVEEYLGSLSANPLIVQRRDPFFKLNPPFEIPLKEDSNKIDMSKPVLERYPIKDYQVVAVLLGDKYPRALIKMPVQEKGNKTLIVKEHDKLGNKSGLVKKIGIQGLLVTEKVRSPLGYYENRDENLPIATPGIK